MNRILFFTLVLLFSTMSVTQFAQAEENPEHNSQINYTPLSSLYKCADIQDADKRLACYDNTVSSLRTAEQKNEIVAIDAKAAQKIKREAFGFNLPSLAKIGLPKLSLPGSKNERADKLVAKIKSIRKSGRTLIITLENGQVWKQISGRFSYIPKGDLTATIKPKTLGSYMMSISNGKSTVRGLRVRRVE